MKNENTEGGKMGEGAIHSEYAQRGEKANNHDIFFIYFILGQSVERKINTINC